MTDTNDVPEAGPTSSEPKPIPSSSSATNSTGNDVTAVNLRIRSPSAEVGGDLNFEHLPATTTVRELKERIRNILDSSPSDDQQRLIHMGKYLRGDQTLMEIFGEEALKSPEQRTLHLVLRNPQDATSTLDSHGERVDAHTGPHMPSAHFPPPFRPHDPNMPPPVMPSFVGPRRTDHRPGHLPQVFQGQNRQPFHHITPAEMENRLVNEMQHRLVLQRLQAEHQELTEQLNSYLHPGQASAVHRSVENLANAVHRAREDFANGRLPPHGPQNASAPQLGPNAPAIAPHEAQHPPNIPGIQQYALPGFQNLLAQQQQQATDQAIRQGTPSRGHTPDHTATFTRQGINSNGERWQITVNESTTVIPPGSQQPQPQPAPGNDIQANLQHLLHSAERLAAMATRLNNLTQRPAGLPTPPGMPPGNPPQRPSSTPPTGRSLRPTAPSTNSFPMGTTMPSVGPLPSNDSPTTVYIMNSPAGPQALLIHNSQTFYSASLNPAQQPNNFLPVPGGEVRNRRDRPHRHRHRNRDANVQPADGVNAAPQPHAAHAPAARPGAQPQGFALWPHIWLIIRLAIFIWYFTAGGNSSWSRIFIIWGMSLFLFVFNTGAFNDLLGALWNPIRQHLETLLPLAGHNHPEAAPARANAENAAGAAAVPNAEPSPEEVARRLLQQRRQQDVSWFMTQFRRVEHAVLLFIASIVPGTAERHIEARTIEENRLLEQRRQEAAAAAAALEAARDETQEGEAAAVPDSAQSGAVNGNGQGDGSVARVEQEQAAVPT